MLRACDVCALLDNDTTLKDVAYCQLCEKWMCTRCRNSPFRRRLTAFAINVRQKITSALKGN